MKRSYKLEGEICANCAQKIEDEITKLDGVSKARVNFMMLRFTLDADDSQFQDIFNKSIKIFDKIEPTCKVVA